MIVELTNYSEFHARKNDFSPRWCRLLDAQNNVLIPYNRDLKTLEKHYKEIDQFVKSLEPGTYIIECRRSRNTPGVVYTFDLGEGSKEVVRPQTVYLNDPAPKKTTLKTDSEILDLMIENERMKLEIQALKDTIEDLENELTTLEEAAPLSDAPKAPAWIETIKELIPTIGDPILQQWKAQNDIKAAEIGYKYELLKLQQLQQQRAPQAPPQYQEPTTQAPSLEELEAARQNAPADFYAWIADPNNKAYYDQLKAQYDEPGI
jgi:hypothetical protein